MRLTLFLQRKTITGRSSAEPPAASAPQSNLMKRHQARSRELVAEYHFGMLHAALLVGIGFGAALLILTHFA